MNANVDRPIVASALDSLGVVLSLGALVCALYHVSQDLRPFDPVSISHGLIALGTIVVLMLSLRRMLRSLLLVPLFLIITGNALALAAWLTLLSASLLLGSWLTQRFTWLTPLRSTLTEFGASFIVGFAANGIVIWLAMHFPINYTGVYWVFFLAEVVVFGLLHRKSWRIPSIFATPGRWVILGFGLFVLPYAVVPAYNFDDLSTHLFIPQQTKLFGIFEFSPHFAMGLTPCLLSIGSYTGAFLLGGENAVRLLNISLFVFSALALEAGVRRFWGANASLFATLFSLSTPFTCWILGIVFVDSFFLFFATILLLHCVAIVRDNSSNWLPSCGLLFGLSYLAKQQIIFLLLPISFPLALVALRRARQQPRESLKQLAWAAALCIGAILPPLLHNYALSGNPIYPFYNAVFRSPYWPAENLKDTRWSQALSASSIWDLTFDGTLFVENMRYAFGFSAFVFAPLLLTGIAVSAVRKRWALLWLTCCVIAYAWICYKMTGLYMRYLVGATVPLSIALGLLVSEVCSRSRFRRWVTLGILGVVVAGNLAAFVSIRNGAEPYPVYAAVTGSVEESSMVYHRNFKRLFKKAANKFGKDSLGLLVETPANYFAESRVTSNYWFFPTMSAALRGQGTPDALFEFIFHETRADYLIMPLSSAPGVFGAPDFQQRLKLRDRTADFGLFVPRKIAPAQK